MAEVQLSNADDTQGLHSLTCISCRLMFSTTKEQRNHYQSDLHRFNLKRKVAELPPVSMEVYEQKVKNMQKEEGKTRGQKERTVESYVCEICDKHYNSPNAHAQHLKSNKHIERASKADAQDIKPKTKENTVAPSTPKEVQISAETSSASKDTAMETEKDEESMIEERLKNARKLLPEECLFCLFKSSDLQSNLHHMTHSHGFFVPDLEYLSDLEGLMSYLGDKISVGFTCLYCNGKGKSFWSMEAVQTHMRDLSHCKLAYEENEDEYEDFYDFSTDYSSNEQLIPYNNDPNVKLSENGNELIFGNGKIVGHRSLNVFYKQKYHTSKNSTLINSLVSEYKLLGWNNSTQKKATVPPVSRAELRNQAWYQMKVSFAKNNQKHFKDSTKLL